MLEIENEIRGTLKWFLLNYWLYIEIYKKTEIYLNDNLEISSTLNKKILNHLESIDLLKDNSLKNILLELTSIQNMNIEEISDLLSSLFIKYNFSINWESEKSIYLESEITKIFKKIKNSANFISTEKYFDLLDKIHIIVSKLSFSDNFLLSVKLNNFVREFDRVDDLNTRKELFNKIKNSQGWF